MEKIKDDDPDWIIIKKCDNCNFEKLNEDVEPCRYCLNYSKWQPMKGEKQMAETVNHPQHYNRENSMECIEEMILVFGKEAVKHFCLCNAWKYRYRAADKNGKEDIAKSDWYMNKYKELSNEKTKSYSITANNNPQTVTIGGKAIAIPNNEYISVIPATTPLREYEQLDWSTVPTYTTIGVVNT